MDREAEFNDEMYLGYELLKREIGYKAERFRQMLDEHGGVQTAQILLERTSYSYGLEKLYWSKRLQNSMEAVVLKPKFHCLFTERQRSLARAKLESLDFNVDAYLARQSAD